MSEKLVKNSGTFLPIAICMAFIAMFVVGAVQSSIPATADAATPVDPGVTETALVDGPDGTSESLEVSPEPATLENDEVLQRENLENGEEDVETVAYVEGAVVPAVEGGEPLFSQC